MKNKIFLVSILLFTMLLFLYGCTSKENQSNTSKHSDCMWDYSSGIQPYISMLHAQVLMQPNGFYFVEPTKSMLYFYDYKAKRSVLVCNKPDCEHRSGYNDDGGIFTVEGDDALQASIGTPPTDCNAFLGTTGNLTIYNNRIYYDSNYGSDIGVSNHSIYSIKMDGTDRRVELKNYITLRPNDGVMIFFSGDKFFFSKSIDETHNVLNMVDLHTKKITKLVKTDPSKIFDDIPVRYKNFVYYILWNKFDEENPKYVGTLYQFSLKTKKTTAIYTGDIAGYTFVKNQIYFSDGKSICKMTLNGNDLTPVFEAPGYLDICFDGKYLYLDEEAFLGLNQPIVNPIFVTKLDGSKIDSMERLTGYPLYGDQNAFFYYYTYKLEDDSYYRGLVMLKKTDLGKPHHYYDLVTGKEVSIEQLTKKLN